MTLTMTFQFLTSVASEMFTHDTSILKKKSYIFSCEKRILQDGRLIVLDWLRHVGIMTLSLLSRRVRTDQRNTMSHWRSFRYIFPYGTVAHVVVKYDFSFKSEDMSFTLMKIKVSWTETGHSSYTFRLHDHLYKRHILLNGSSLYFIILCPTEKHWSDNDQSIKVVIEEYHYFLANDIVINETFQYLEVGRSDS